MWLNNFNNLIFFHMNKIQKHEKAEEFRRLILQTSARKAQIEEFLEKETYDEADLLRLKILFQKASYFTGCELAYRKLMAKLQDAEPELQAMIQPFQKRFKIA